MAKPYLKFGDILIREGLITKDQLAKALEAQKKAPRDFLGAILVKMGAITPKDFAVTLGKQLNVAFLSRESGGLTPVKSQGLEKLIPEETARRHHLLPLRKEGSSLTVAFVDPTDVVVLDNLRKLTECSIVQVIGTMEDVEAAISDFYGEGGMLKKAIEASYLGQEAPVEAEHEEELSLDGLVASAQKSAVIQLADLIIRQAIKERASDIHIEPFRNQISIRFRIDGVLHEIPPPEKSMMMPLVSRLKILSNMDIAEKRLPQDGSFRATIENRAIDFRVSTVPTVHGEKMVLRILDKRATSLNLETLGFSKEELELYRTVIHKPYGLILITGPTGSGKTTTLYAALNELKGPDKNILTVEDPVEYQMEGINQIQVKPNIGLTFAAGLRAFLRQDPDVILVGETRDAETDQICVRAALTGHLVFSTLHTNDAPSSITRLIDIGVEPFLVSSSLLMIVAQRLVRKLCPKCKESYKPSPSQLPKNFTLEANTLYRPKGCDACSKTGYLGRMALFEIMTVNDRLQELIAQRASMTLIRVEAKKSGMASLEQSGFKKINAGETSVEEVLRVTLAGA
ncbi:MAG: Flp pilus assembly complex ATPase component TadA [Candidatus Omnitrophica bacterium]|nr:Flp pilus assembly complex ATPase component TadA [Candidatus Omnitrophota bacterium]